MSKHSDKQFRELKIFQRFADAAELPIVKGTIINCEDPQPDIKCEIEGEGLVWFEISETCSQDAARAMNTLPESGVWSGWIGENTEETVESKTGKSYEADGPIELVMYDDGRTPKTDAMLIDSIRFVLESGTGMFRRVWFFGRSGVKVVWPSAS